VDPTLTEPLGPMAGPAVPTAAGSGLPLLLPPGLVPVQVDPKSGLPVTEGGVPVLTTPGTPRQRFRPFRPVVALGPSP